MSATDRQRSIVWFLLVALALGGLVVVARSFVPRRSIESVVIEARVDSLGGLDVTEERTLVVPPGTTVEWAYMFRVGAVFEVLGVSGDDGELVLSTDPAAETPGTYTVVGDDDEAQIVAFPEPSETPQTLTLRYRVQGAAVCWSDTAEFSWPFIRDAEKLPADSVRIHLVLPAELPPSEVSAWTNGPLYSETTVHGDGSVDVVAPDLPPKTELEVRVLFPTEALPDRFKSPWKRVADVVAYEEGIEAQVTIGRFMDRASQAIAWVFGLLAPVVALGYTIGYRWFYRHQFRPAYRGEYYRESPADVMPAFAAALLEGEVAEERALAATVADLVRRGALSLACPTRDIASCTLSLPPGGLPEELTRSERYFVTTLFDRVMQTDAFMLGDLSERLATEEGAAACVRLCGEFPQRVGNELVLRRLVEHRVTYAGTGFMWAAAALLGVGLLAQSMADVPLLVAPSLLVSPIVVLFAVKMRFIVQQGEDLAGKYRGVRNYLRDLPAQEEPLPASPDHWRRLLTLAVLFDVAEPVVGTLGARLPELAGEIESERWLWASEFANTIARRGRDSGR